MTDDQILDLLCERFPQTFARNPAERRPLQRGIGRETWILLAGEVGRHALKRVLLAYVTCSEYRVAVVEGAARIDLDGRPSGAVTANEAAQARRPQPAKTTPMPPPASTPSSQPKRLSLEDLRKAARERKGLA
jgi:sRNA-binding protein